jgi:hypothetical protein
MTQATDILIFVEDPGAANYVAGLPEAFTSRGWTCRLLAAGAAVEYLRQRGRRPECVEPDTTAASLLSAFSPRVVLVGTSENPHTLGLALIAEAWKHGIPSLGAVDALVNAEYRFRGRGRVPLAFAPSWLLLPDAFTQDAFVALGYPRERAVVCGHPHYEAVRSAGALLAAKGKEAVRRFVLPTAPSDRPVLLFAAEISDGVNAAQYRLSAEYTLRGRGISTGRTEIVLEECLDALALIRPRPYVVLRLHPKNRPDEYAAYAAEIDCMSRGGSALEWIYAADIVVGMTSMLLLEATLLNRPTLSILPRAVEKDWLPTTRAGVTLTVTDRSQLHQNLLGVLAGKLCPNEELSRLFGDEPVRRVVEVADKVLKEAKQRSAA